MIGSEKDLTFFNSSFFHLFSINFFFFMGIFSMSILPSHLNSIGATKTYIGFFMNVQSLELVIFVLLFGKYSNKINRKNFLLLGFILFFISMFFMFIFYKNLILLLIFRVISSISFAFGFTLLFSLIYDLLPEEKRRGAVAFYGISGLLGNSISSYMGEKVNIYFGAQYVFILSAFFMVVAIMLTIRLKETAHLHKEKSSLSFWAVLKKEEIKSLAIVSMIHGGAFGILVSFIPNYTEKVLGVANVSIYLLGFSFIAIMFRLILFKILDAFPKKNLILFSLSCILLSLVFILKINSLWQLLAIGLIMGIGHSIIFPTLSVGFVERADEGQKNIFNNAFLAINTFGVIFFSTTFGMIGDILGIRSIFISMAIIAFYGIMVAIFSKHLHE